MAGRSLAAIGSSVRPIPAARESTELPPQLQHRRRAEIAYAPQGATLEEYILDRTRRCFIMGPLGSGKTNASCWKGFRLCLEQAPVNGVRLTRGICVRNTYPDLFSTTVKDWLDMFGDFGRFVQGGKEPPTHYMKFDLPDGTKVDAEIVFLALDREDHVKKLRGLQATWAWVNEAKEIPKPIIDMLDLRVGRYPSPQQGTEPTWYGVFGDTNAPDNDHWYYRLAEEMKPTGWKFLRQPGGLLRQSPDHPWELNPRAENVHNLPLNYYVNGAQGKKDNWVKVNLANEYGYVGDGMPVWPEYRDDVHCKPFELVPGLPLHIGLDFGLTPAAVIGQRLPNGQMRWRHEVVTTDTGVGRFAGILKRFLSAHCPGFSIGSITGDPAGDQRQVGDNEERTVFQLLEANGIVAIQAHTNDFTVRTEAVARPMRMMVDGQAAILIHPDMATTRKGMAGAYKFRRLKVAGDERYEDKPVKNAYSHPCEALQYGQMGVGEGMAVLQANTAAHAEDARAYREQRAISRATGHPIESLAGPSANPQDVKAFRRKRGL